MREVFPLLALCVIEPDASSSDGLARMALHAPEPGATEDAIRLLAGRSCGVGLAGDSGDILDRQEAVE